MTLEDIKAARHEIEMQIADLQKKLAALDVVIAMFSSHGVIPSGPSQVPVISKAAPGDTILPASGLKTLAGPSLIEAIRNTLKEMPDQFNVRYVRRAMYKAKPGYTFLTSSLSNALKKMADAGEIKLVMLGSGRSPSRYAKTGLVNTPTQTKP